MESKLDLNLLTALHALVEHGSVTGAAEHLHTSPPAMSRTLARLRRALGDPVLVRAGRGMVPTPRAVQLLPRVRALLDEASALFVPAVPVDPAALRREFAVQVGDMVFSGIGERLLRRVREVAPGVTLRFMAESHEDTPSLRDGSVDLELGRINVREPEIELEPLLTENGVGVLRAGHPLADGPVDLARFAAADHISVSRRGRLRGPIDELLAGHGLRRRVVACTPTLAGALFLIGQSDLVGLAPRRLGAAAVHALGLDTFEIPLELPPTEISMAWHPRHSADPEHTWLRDQVRDVVSELI